MSRFFKVLCVLNNDSALPEDLAINTFHFITSEVGTEGAETFDIETQLRLFYADVDIMLSENLNPTNGLRTVFYNHLTTPPRVPIRDDSANITPGTDSLPNEVSICLSYKQNAISGVQRRRQRGRIYLGPLSRNSYSDATGDGRVSGAAMTSIADSAHDNLMSFTGATSGSSIQHCVFSRSDALGLDVGEAGPSTEPDYTLAQLVAGYKPIQQYWVDDAYDTQRRRGKRSTTRTIGA